MSITYKTVYKLTDGQPLAHDSKSTMDAEWVDGIHTDSTGTQWVDEVFLQAHKMLMEEYTDSAKYATDMLVAAYASNLHNLDSATSPVVLATLAMYIA